MEAEKKDIKKSNRRIYYTIGLAGQVTFLLVGPVVGSLLLGLWLDNLLHSSPLFIILGVVLGFIGSIVNVFKVMKMIDRP